MARVIKKVLAKAIGGDLAALAQDTLGEFCRRSRQGGVVPLKIGFSRGFLVSDPAVVRRVLLDNIANYDKRTPSFEAVRIVLGNGMLTSDGAFWKRQRRIAQPAFHGESVKRFGPIIARMAAGCADRWEQAAPGGRDGRCRHRHDGRHATSVSVVRSLWNPAGSGVQPDVFPASACRWTNTCSSLSRCRKASKFGYTPFDV